jgi:DNA-binding transcriptional regulator YdaS (Cro superfamily)
MPVVPYVKQTWTDGVSSGSAARFTVIEQGIHEVSLAPAVRVFHSASQTITTGTVTALAFNSERFDQAAGSASTMHDTATNNSRLTCLYAGVYMVSANIEWAANATSFRRLTLRTNGGTSWASTDIEPETAIVFRQALTGILIPMAVNDYVEAVVQQNTGGALAVSSVANVSPEFMMVRVA